MFMYSVAWEIFYVFLKVNQSKSSSSLCMGLGTLVQIGKFTTAEVIS